MKFLVIGCNGMAGSTISLYLKEKGYDVKGFARKESNFVPTFVGDARDFKILDKIILEEKFDIIINCIGLLNQNANDNKEDAIILNSVLPHHLASITKNTDTRIFHMSTDCVFSGKTGNYAENDFKDGETIYDKTKSLGELSDEKNLTFRNSIVGPDINEDGIGLLNWFMKQTGEIKGFSKAIWTGVTTLELAKAMERASQTKVYGLVNLVNNKSITKYELLELFRKYFSKNDVSITKVEGVNLDKSLRRTNFDFDYKVPSYEQMIKEMSDWVKEHKSLYPHYFKEIK